MSSMILSSNKALADDSVVTTTTISVLESCSMSGTGMSSHVGTIVNGTYSGADYNNGVGTTTLKAFCNDNAGFAIYAIGYTNDEYGNTKLHWSGASSTSDTTNAINTGIYTSGNTTNSTWSMKLASVVGTYAPTIANGTDNTENFTTWHTVPSDYTKVAYRTTGTDIPVNNVGTGSSLTVTYDAYISATQPAGTYVGQVKYTLVHPSTHAKPVQPLKATDCPASSICYAPNADDVEGDMSSLPYTSDNNSATLRTASPRAGAISATANSAATLIAPNFKRSGYGFAGWSTEYNYTSTSTSPIYGPNETISTKQQDDRGLVVTSGAILYPVWVASSGTLQGWTGCSSLTPATYDSTTGKVSATLSSITALTDSRDENTYAVARLADGQCWMVENLRLNNEDTTSAEDIALAQGYGNATTSINASGYNLGEFVGLAASEDANFTNSTTANSLYSIDGSNGTTNIYNDYNAGCRLPRYNKNNTNMTLNATNSDGTTTLTDSYNASNNHVRWYGYGNYYNWPAAMANTEYYTTYSGTNGSDAAGTSICPTGWHLPLGYQSSGTLENGSSDAANRVGGFSYLDRVMGGTGQNQSSTAGSTQSVKWRSFPNNFVYSGSWNGARAYYRSSSGDYWSSSANTGSNVYYLNLGSSSVNPGTSSNVKSDGFAVRCVAGS